MFEATVTSRFKDKFTGRIYQPGDIYRAATIDRLRELASRSVPRVAFDGAAPVYEVPVTHEFLDKYTRVRYRVGDSYRTNSLGRLWELASKDPPRVRFDPDAFAPTEGSPSEPEAASEVRTDEGERSDGADPGEQADGQGLPPTVESPRRKETPLEEIPYRELQARAKERGIKANQGRDALVAALKSE